MQGLFTGLAGAALGVAVATVGVDLGVIEIGRSTVLGACIAAAGGALATSCVIGLARDRRRRSA